MPIDYKIAFTDLAKGFAAKVGGTAAVEEQARGEIAELIKNGLEELSALYIHVVMMKDERGNAVDFICTPVGNDVLAVDTATYEEMETLLEGGPFKGKVVMFPRGDSDE